MQLRMNNTPPAGRTLPEENSSQLSTMQRLRQVLVLSVLLGLLSGLGEGLIDLAVLHYHAPEILCVTILVDSVVFLLLGTVFWALGIGLEQGLSYALVLFILVWTTVHGWGRDLTPDLASRTVWLLNLISTGIFSALISFYVSRHALQARRVVSRTLPWVAGTAAACLIGIPGYPLWVEHRELAKRPGISSSAPNIVLVIVDTLRADHLSCYGYGRVTSPSIDQLARKGVLFENAISPSSWTLPAHASMLTGLYPSEHGAQLFRDQLPPRFATLPEVLSRAGYRAAAFSGSPFFTRRQGLGRGFLDFGDFFFSVTDAVSQVHYISSLQREMSSRGWTRGIPTPKTGAEINRAALRWVDRSDHPFLLVLNYFDAHDPNLLPRQWQHRFLSKGGSPDRVDIDQNSRLVQTPSQIQNKIDVYDGAIAYDDDQMRVLIDELNKRHFLENTLIIVTSDHGEAFGEHGLSTHGTALYFPLIHVPLLFSWLGHIPGGLQIERPVSTKDIPATILALIGMSGDPLPGKSLAAFWTSQAVPNQWPSPLSEVAQSRQATSEAHAQGQFIQSIISSDLQLILAPHSGPSLYHWRADPLEEHNLFLDPRYQAVGAELTAELKRLQ